jgi:hypothetical protein
MGLTVSLDDVEKDRKDLPLPEIGNRSISVITV